MAGWIGVDLDGTLAYYDHWRGPLHIGAPIPTMVRRVQEWLDAGTKVKIFTARVSGENASQIAENISRWAFSVIGEPLEVTCKKDFSMIELWDDRAVQVRMNTGERVG